MPPQNECMRFFFFFPIKKELHKDFIADIAIQQKCYLNFLWAKFHREEEVPQQTFVCLLSIPSDALFYQYVFQQPDHKVDRAVMYNRVQARYNIMRFRSK